MWGGAQTPPLFKLLIMGCHMTSNMPKIKMTLDQWIEFAKSLKYGDECHVFADDVSGEVIEAVSSNNLTLDPLNVVPFLHPVHTFRYFGMGDGRTVEADPKGSQWHHIDEYRDRVIAGDVRIVVFRHVDLTIERFEKLKSEAEHQVGKPYGWGALLGFFLVKIIWNTPLGTIWRDNKWQTPWCDRNNPVCSQGVRLQKDNILEYYEVMKKLSVWQDNTPQRTLNETGALTTYAADSFYRGEIPFPHVGV